MDFLKSAVASAISQGPPFPYTFGDKVDVDESIWTLYNGTRRVSFAAETGQALHQLTAVALGGRIELQHLLIRHHGQEESAAARKECAEEATNIATPRRYQSSRHRRGMRCDTAVLATLRS